MEQRIILSKHFQIELATIISECDHDRIFVLTDETTKVKCWPLLRPLLSLRHAQTITIGVSDTHKNLETLANVWKSLGEKGATRHSLLINLGGGMVTDLGGFAASTFKRGLNFINIPTTLLAMVDASVGGKTGINFNGLKNEVGVFNDPKFVILDTSFLKTLDDTNIRSGYGEMLKHGLISNEKMWAELLKFDLAHPDLAKLQTMVADSVAVKEHIVKEDPHEMGIRKALNFGHTFGHALESWSLKRTPILHGYAVAYGLICELYLSCVKLHFPTEKMQQTVHFIREYYGTLPITCDDYPELIQLMHHDKKNRGNEINVTLLGGIGDIHINQTVSEQEIKEVLDFFREG
ncbi:MAG: 3-dehydroquinate synthase [Prevotella sp.]|jgi:3-dehydroquinate synthase|nr:MULTISPECIES: 3-dehydroquinate synthase [unclassified Prevotella]MCH3970513.1 3-dehydroquinate synthase [Prevotella sp.]MCH3986159.1 3-dehydroquinate synthase [Prevotella sp.]MCH3992951.1 3-dehydroquinate synthase [Prevotella sp.]MCH4018119.1 3-dehydroquinate synthase [Prevotella sp.]MCH4215329.1 3-dehydroquinate synthase [Prevotella sp.]